MLNSKLLLSLIAVASLSCSATFANQVEVTDTSGSFYCVVDTITDHFKTVDINTSGVEVSGFCAGEEYVQNPGHLTGMPMNELKKFYFDYTKPIGKAGTVEVVATNAGDVTCYIGKGEGRKLYGNGKYC